MHHAAKTYALIGPPNTGKSTLYNHWLGAQQSVGNRVGVTVEKKSGLLELGTQTLRLVDLPGVDALIQTQPTELAKDQQITLDYLRKTPPDGLLVVLDAQNLDIQLTLLAQALTLGLPTVLVLHQFERAQRLGLQLDLQAFEQALGLPVVVLESQKDQAQAHAFAQTLFDLPASQTSPSQLDQPSKRCNWVSEALKLAHYRHSDNPWQHRLDALAMHPWLGLPCFLLVMFVTFMGAIEVSYGWVDFFNQIAGMLFIDSVRALLFQIGAPEPIFWVFFQGIGLGLQTVATFIPVMLPLFLALNFLETSGYLSRASWVLNRSMQQFGVSGRAFVPIVLGFGCSVPAIMATRSLSKAHERLIAGLMIPFVSCSAKLPIYAVFSLSFFPEQASIVVFSLYCVGGLVALLTGWLVYKLRFAKLCIEDDIPIVNYQWPKLGQVVLAANQRLLRFLREEGKVIVLAIAIMNSLNYVTFHGRLDQEQAIAKVTSQTLMPVFKPIGLDETQWPAAAAVLAGFFAKEVVVGSLNTLAKPQTQWHGDVAWSATVQQAWQGVLAYFGGFTANKNNSDVTLGASAALQTLFPSAASALAFAVFLVLYAPCISTMATLAREFGSAWASLTMLWSLWIAYAAAVLCYQCLMFAEQPWISGIWCACIGLIFVLGFVFLKKQSQKQSQMIPIVEIQ